MKSMNAVDYLFVPPTDLDSECIFWFQLGGSKKYILPRHTGSCENLHLALFLEMEMRTTKQQLFFSNLGQKSIFCGYTIINLTCYLHINKSLALPPL